MFLNYYIFLKIMAKHLFIVYTVQFQYFLLQEKKIKKYLTRLFHHQVLQRPMINGSSQELSRRGFVGSHGWNEMTD